MQPAKLAFKIAPPPPGRRNAFQQHKAAEDARRRREEVEAQAALHDFVASLEVGATATSYSEQMQPPASAVLPSARKKRNLDTFLDEIKRGQQQRDEAHRRSRSPPAARPTPRTAAPRQHHHDSRGESAKILVASLPDDISEWDLTRTFGRFGRVVHVSISRTRQDSADCTWRGSLAFITFDTHENAKNAIITLNRTPAFGRPSIIVDWAREGQLLPTPQHAAPCIRVGIPSNTDLLRAIHRTVERTIHVGPDFELALLESERSNPLYRFLHDFDCSDHHYYRWRLYATLQGDDASSWRTEPFQMVENGPKWIPPPMPPPPSPDEARERILGKLDRPTRQRLEQMLVRVVDDPPLLDSIRLLAIERADAATEIADILARHCLAVDVDVRTTKARFATLDAVLDASGSTRSHAWKLRNAIEVVVVDILAHIGTIYRSFTSRLKAEQFKEWIMDIVHNWKLRAIFPDDVIHQLQQHLARLPSLAVPALPPAAGDVDVQNLAAEMAEDLDGDGGGDGGDDRDGDDGDGDRDGDANDDLDGVPLDDIDGVPIAITKDDDDDTDLDGVPLDDIDGVPIAITKDDDDDDLDGVPLGDIDGEPIATAKEDVDDDDDTDDDLDGEPLPTPNPGVGLLYTAHGGVQDGSDIEIELGQVSATPMHEIGPQHVVPVVPEPMAPISHKPTVEDDDDDMFA